MKGLVLGGCGLQGEPIAYGLTKLGYEIKTVDSNGSPDVYLDMGQLKSFGAYLDKFKPDFCVSALPYFLNREIAIKCIDKKISWFDLGGHVATTKFINTYGKDAKCNVMTDLGLAPGLVNILGLTLLYEYPHSHKLSMYCGGIPSPVFRDSSGPLKYGLTWSTKGLVNEYLDPCTILSNSLLYEVPGLSGLEKFSVPGMGELEAFHTSGGIGTFFDKLDYDKLAIKECSYKTLRWPGHRNAIQSISSLCNHDREKVADYIEVICPDFRKYNYKDVVVIVVALDLINKVKKVSHTAKIQKVVKILGDTNKKEEKPSNFGKLISINPKDFKQLKEQVPKYSAMQKATAFSCVSMIEVVNKYCQNIKGTLSYTDFVSVCGSMELFVQTMSNFGIQL